MRTIIAGSRGFTDYDLLVKSMEEVPFRPEIKEVVSGGARGADRLGERWCREELGTDPIVMVADWDTHGKRAGFLRNIQMAEMSNGLVAFWDGESRGTSHMISEARKLGLKVHVVRINE